MDSYTRTLEEAGARRTRRGMEQYDLAAAFRYGLSGRKDASGCPLAALLDDEFRAAGGAGSSYSPHSVLVPGAAFLRYIESQRTAQNYQTTVTSSGAELVENTFRPDLFIDALRSRSVALSLGAQNVGGLQGDVTIPRMDTASTGYWLTTTGSSPVVSGAITESEGTFDATPLTVAPAQIGSYGKISRNLLLQGGDLVSAIIANDASNVLGTAIDVAAIAGSGSSGQPTGITNTSGINTASGASFTYATSVSAVQSVATANAIINRRALGWTATPTVAGVLTQRQKVSGFPAYVWDGNVDTGAINGHRALSSNNVPASAAIFGDWSQVLVLSWGESSQVLIEFNPFSGGGFAGGDVQYRAILSCNVVVRHAPSFTLVSSIT